MPSKHCWEFDVLKRFAVDHGLPFLAVYGSFARGTQTAESDVDIVVDTSESLLPQTESVWANELEAALHRKVDLIEARAMISSPLCGHVWRLHEYHVIHGQPVVRHPETLPGR